MTAQEAYEYITETLNLRQTQSNRQRILNIMARNGTNSQLVEKCVSNLIKMEKAGNRASIEDFINLYTGSQNQEFDECTICNNTGFVKIILLQGNYKGISKNYIYNFWDSSKQLNFLRENPSFKAVQGFHCCRCEQGAYWPLNIKEGTRQENGISRDQKTLAVSRSVNYKQGKTPLEADAFENYYLDETLLMLNAYIKGKSHKIRKLDQYGSIEELQEKASRECRQLGRALAV